MRDLTREQQIVVTALENSMMRLGMLVDDLMYDQLDMAGPESGSWTIREIIQHLADDGDFWSIRLKQAIAMPGITVNKHDYPGNEVWAGSLDFVDRDTGPALGLIRAHNAYYMELLRRFQNAWDRSITIFDRQADSRQTMSVKDMAEMLVRHTNEHLDQIESIRVQHGMA